MEDSLSHRDPISEHVMFTEQISKWLQKNGVEQADMAVDITDILAAADRVRKLIQELIALDLSNLEEIDRALGIFGRLDAWLFTEIKPHLDELERTWPVLRNHLEELTPKE